MVYCSAVNTPILVNPGNYVECQVHTVGPLCTRGSPVIFRSFEHVSVSRNHRIGGDPTAAPSISSPSLLFPLILLSIVFRAPLDQTSHLSLLSSGPQVFPDTVNISKASFRFGFCSRNNSIVKVPTVLSEIRYF